MNSTSDNYDVPPVNPPKPRRQQGRRRGTKRNTNPKDTAKRKGGKELSRKSKRRKTSSPLPETSEPQPREPEDRNSGLAAMPTTLRDNRTAIQAIISKPKSAWIFFVMQYKSQLPVTKDSPAKPVSSIVKECSSVWKIMSVDEKQVFQDRSNKDTERYETEMRNMPEEIQQRLAALRANAKSIKAKNTFKFRVFSERLRPTLSQDLSKKELKKKTREIWKSMSTTKRTEFMNSPLDP